MPHSLTLSQFVKIIRSLELEGYIRQHFTLTVPYRDTVQLPFEVTCAFGRLDHSLHDPRWRGMSVSPLKYFDDFLLQLVVHARSNAFNPTVEDSHVEYLLGFLLHLDLQITHDNETRNFEESMFAQFPRSVASYIRWGHYPTKHPICVPAEGYDFLSADWRKTQNYPTIETLQECWLNLERKKIAEAEQQQQLVLLEQKKQQLEREAEYNRRQQELAFINKHCFVDVLTLEQFSYVLEGFIKSGKIKLPYHGQFFNQDSILSTALATKIVQFSQLARQNIHLQNKSQAFIQLIKDIIAEAKAHSPARQAAQLLLGFLMYHNFQISDGYHVCKMREIYWLEANPVEKMHLQAGQDSIPVSNPQWLQQQGFPGKDTLELLLRSPAPSHYLPGYQKQAGFMETTPNFGVVYQPQRPLTFRG